jgi:hypothetical protein
MPIGFLAARATRWRRPVRPDGTAEPVQVWLAYTRAASCLSPVARGSVPFARRDVAGLLAGERRGSPVDAVAGQSAARLEHLSLWHMAEQPNPRHRRLADAPFAAGSDMGWLMRLLYGADHDGPCCGMPVGRATRRVPRRDDHLSHYPQRPPPQRPTTRKGPDAWSRNLTRSAPWSANPRTSIVGELPDCCSEDERVT